MTWLILQILICLLLAFALGFLLGWWLRGSRCEKTTADLQGRLRDCRDEMAAMKKRGPSDSGGSQSMGIASGVAAAAPAVAAAAASTGPDDLKKVEGIGPKIEELLNGGGIHTFVELANAEYDRLKSILDAAGPRYQMHDPKTWPEQAGLAAEGRWDDLERLQDILQGGKDS